jgi:electron transfer flavoprotein alpha subunit
LDIDPEKKILLQTRPAFGGNIMATIISPNYRPQMATVRHKVFAPMPADKKRKGKIIKESFDSALYVSRTKLLDIIEEIESTINLSEADIIVSAAWEGRIVSRSWKSWRTYWVRQSVQAARQ